MKNIKILVGPKPAELVVPSTDVTSIPGLAIHRSTGDISSTDRLATITHVKSGLWVVHEFIPELLELLIPILSKCDWTLDSASIRDSDKHNDCMTEAADLLEFMKKAFEKQEIALADDLGGKRQPASGSKWGYRRDVITPDLLIEAKTTTLNSYRVSIKDLQYLRSQANLQGKSGVYVVEISGIAWVCVFSSELLDNPEFSKVISAKGKAGFSISAKTAAYLEKTKNLIKVETNTDDYALMTYSSFLELYAKKEIT